ncbi:MAG: hypothetical protein ACHQT9_03550 [Candidatus Saccharimonadales bacterium]
MTTAKISLFDFFNKITKIVATKVSIPRFIKYNSQVGMVFEFKQSINPIHFAVTGLLGLLHESALISLGVQGNGAKSADALLIGKIEIIANALITERTTRRRFIHLKLSYFCYD